MLQGPNFGQKLFFFTMKHIEIRKSFTAYRSPSLPLPVPTKAFACIYVPDLYFETLAVYVYSFKVPSLSLFFTIFPFCMSAEPLKFRKNNKDKLLLAQWTN